MRKLVQAFSTVFLNCFVFSAIAFSTFADVRSFKAKRLVSGTYLGNLTEIYGTPLPKGAVQFNEIYHIDGTFTLESYAPNNPNAPTRINHFYAQGEWEITRILKNGDIVVTASYSGMFVDNPPQFAPGGECIVGCLDKNFFSWIYEVKTGKMKNGVGNAVFIEYLTGKVVEGVTFPFKFEGVKTDLIESNKQILRQQGIPIPQATP